MCSLGGGNCFFCVLIKYGNELSLKVTEYRNQIRDLNNLLGIGCIRVAQVDPAPIISTPGGMGLGRGYGAFLDTANTKCNALQFIKGAHAILSHDFAAFRNCITVKEIRSFFFAQLVSEFGRGHGNAVMKLLNELANDIQDSKKRRKISSSVDTPIDICKAVVELQYKYQHLQRRGGYDIEPHVCGIRSVTPRNLFVFGITLKNLSIEIIKLCNHIEGHLVQYKDFTVDPHDLAPKITCYGIPRSYPLLLTANIDSVRTALAIGMDTVISDDGVLELLATVCVAERARFRYDSAIETWVNAIRRGCKTYPPASFM